MTLSQVAVGSASLADGRLVDSAHQTQSKRPPSYDILGLPAEIVQEIACHALPADPRPLLREAPLSISQVCSLWRQAIITFPVVWRKLRIELYMGFRIDVVCNSLFKYFGRVGERGLILHLVFHQEHHHPPTHWIDPAELTLLEHKELAYISRLEAQKAALNFLQWLFSQQLTARIQKLQVTTTMQLEKMMPSNISPPNFSRLECLKFDGHMGFSLPPTFRVGLSGILKDAPVLRSLILSGSSSNRNILTLPLKQLRCLYLSIPISDAQVVGLLDTCPSLERLRIQMSCHSDWNLNMSYPNHQNLVDFHIRLDRPIDLFGILTCRTFKKLSSLHIDIQQSRDILPPDLTRPSVSQTIPNLRSLYIHAPSPGRHPTSYHKYFQNHPQLTHLFVDADVSKLNLLADALANPSDIQPPGLWAPLSFTNLQSLTLTFLNVQVVDDEADIWYDRFPEHQEVVHLLEALLSRTKYSQQRFGSTTEPLTTCRLSLHMKDSPDHIEPVARMVAKLSKELDFVLDTSAREVFAIKSNADVEWFES